jgi:hypothetical protein
MTAHRYVDGLLSGDESEEFEKHLAGCAGCALLVADLRKLAEIFGNKDRVLPEPGFRERVLRAAMSGGAGENRFRRNSTVIFMKRLAATAACLCCLMSCSIYFLLNQRVDQPAGISKTTDSAEAGVMDTYFSSRLTNNEMQFISGENPKAVESYIRITMIF